MMKKIKNKSQLMITILVLFAISFMTVGFARYNQVVNLGGTAVVKPDGKLTIHAVQFIEGANYEHEPQPNVLQGSNVNFDLAFETVTDSSANYYAIYNITIKNDSSYDYVYSIPGYHPTIQNGLYDDYIEYEISQISAGEVIAAKSEKTFQIRFDFTNPQEETGIYEVEGNFTPDLTSNPAGSIHGSVGNSVTIDLRDPNEYALVTMHVINLYDTAKTFTISLESDKFKATNLTHNGAATYMISANNDGQDFQFYVEIDDEAIFNSNREKVRVLLTPEGGSAIQAEKITILVDKTEEYHDVTPPTISDVTATILNTQGSVKLTWSGSDDSGSISNYTIIGYKNGEEFTRVTTQDDTEEYTFTNITEDDSNKTANFYFVVCGIDADGNTANASQIADATSNEGPACRTEDMKLRWTFTVTNNSDSAVVSVTPTITSISRGSTYSATIRAVDTTHYNHPRASQVSITMDGRTVNSNYNASTGAVSVANVTGDLVINAQATRKNSGGCG